MYSTAADFERCVELSMKSVDSSSYRRFRASQVQLNDVDRVLNPNIETPTIRWIVSRGVHWNLLMHHGFQSHTQPCLHIWGVRPLA